MFPKKNSCCRCDFEDRQQDNNKNCETDELYAPHVKDWLGQEQVKCDTSKTRGCPNVHSQITASFRTGLS